MLYLNWPVNKGNEINKVLATGKLPSDAMSEGATSKGENIMDAKYNWMIDNAAIRVTLNTVAFALWLAVAVGLLELAVKV